MGEKIEILPIILIPYPPKTPQISAHKLVIVSYPNTLYLLNSIDIHLPLVWDDKQDSPLDNLHLVHIFHHKLLVRCVRLDTANRS